MMHLMPKKVNISTFCQSLTFLQLQKDGYVKLACFSGVGGMKPVITKIVVTCDCSHPVFLFDQTLLKVF